VIEYLIPNKEVKMSLTDVLIDFMTNQKTEKIAYQNSLYDALYDNNLDELELSLKSIFASIPYNNYLKNNIANYKGYYAGVIYVYLQSLGFNMVGEDVTNKGRIDLTVITDNYIYIIEFKMSDNNNALEQIKEKKYAQKYLTKSKDIYLLGIDFDKDEKNICGFEWERV
jgi:Holliday junction resolvase-like predicted endonuclease